MLGGGPADRPGNAVAGDLLDPLAAPADEQGTGVFVVRVRAADEGVQRVEPVDEARADEELECAVHRHRAGGTPGARQAAQDLVGAERGVAGPDDLEDLPAGRREREAAIRADALRRLQGGAPAGGVVVVGRGGA